MLNSWIIGVLIVMFFMLCRSAIANELFRYNYVKAVYGKATYDMQGSSQKADGSLYGVIGSYAIHELVAIGVQYEKTKKSFDGSFSGTPVSITSIGNSLAMGVTLHKMVSNSTELGLDLVRDHSSADATTATFAGVLFTVPASTDNTNAFGIRVSTAIVPEFRLMASVGRTTGGNFAVSTDYSIGAEYELGKNFSMDAKYVLNTISTGNSRGLIVNGRYYY